MTTITWPAAGSRKPSRLSKPRLTRSARQSPSTNNSTKERDTAFAGA
jgi:hypothetical protein